MGSKGRPALCGCGQRPQNPSISTTRRNLADMGVDRYAATIHAENADTIGTLFPPVEGALTFMATRANIRRLKVRGDVDLVETEMEWNERAERELYASAACIAWMNGHLAGLETRVCCDATPLEQVESLFHRFITGKVLVYSYDLRDLEPLDAGIWELKSPDLRFFGWFPVYNTFIVAYCDDASKIKEYNLYSGYIQQCLRLRDKLPVDQPTFIDGGLSDVISN